MPVARVTTRNVTRVTIDLEVTQYGLLNEALKNHNAGLGQREHRMTRSRLVRSLLGSWARNEID